MFTARRPGVRGATGVAAAASAPENPPLEGEVFPVPAAARAAARSADAALPIAAAASTAPPASLSKKDLLEKAGEKDADTTYTRLMEQAFDAIPALTENERTALRAVARKRQARLKLALRDDPAGANAPAAPAEDDLTAFERELLGPERHRVYQTAVTDTLRP